MADGGTAEPTPPSTPTPTPEVVVPLVEIKVRDHGCYKVTGPVRLIDAQGREFPLPPGSAIALCRCGYSTTKPFCDGSHREAGFAGCERAGD